MDTKILNEIGLGDGEIKVYLSLLKLGLITAGPIIKETKLQSSSVYHILDSLLEKGIISFQIKNNIKHFYAASPESLKNFVESKKKKHDEKLDEDKKQLDSLIPQLAMLQNINTSPNQQALIYEGWNGMLTAFKEAHKQVKNGTTIYVYIASNNVGEADIEQIRWLMNKVREIREEINKKQGKKISLKIIAQSGSIIAKDQSKNIETKVKFVNRKDANHAVINIYEDVTLIALWLKKPLAFYIISKEVADSFRNNFDLIWNTK